MMMLLTLLACSESHKSYFYDISSTILVTDDTGMQVNIEDIEFCQKFQSVDYSTLTEWTVNSESCETVDIEDGVAILSNWEGEYFGPDVSLVIDMTYNDEIFQAEILDNDTDVWCDNEVITEVGENNNITYNSLCSENYERYLLWSLVIPSKRNDSD